VSALITSIASIPSPGSGSISIGPLDLRAYGLLIALGVIAAVWLLGRLLEQWEIGSRDDASSIGMWGVVAGVIGARLYHVITEWSRFSGNLGDIPKIWEGGLGIPGGLIAGIAVGAWQAKRRGIPPLMIITAAVPGIALAQSIGRWGNYFNQELFGKPTDLPWALEIDDAHNMGYPSGTTFHPTFLYESLWTLALAIVLLRVQRKYRLAPGRLLGVYLIGYGTGRFWIEGLRIDHTNASDVFGMRWNQWMALAAVIGGAIYLIVTRGQKWPADAPLQVARRKQALGLPPVNDALAEAEVADEVDPDTDRAATDELDADADEFGESSDDDEFDATDADEFVSTGDDTESDGEDAPSD